MFIKELTCFETDIDIYKAENEEEFYSFLKSLGITSQFKAENENNLEVFVLGAYPQVGEWFGVKSVSGEGYCEDNIYIYSKTELCNMVNALVAATRFLFEQ